MAQATFSIRMDEKLKKELSKESVWATLSITEVIDDMDYTDVVGCTGCRYCKEQGGHANCGGYLYCRKWKTLVDEDSYCSWGERNE